MTAKSVLRTSLAIGTTAVQVANNFGGVPLLGVAAAILNEIGQACDQVLMNKRQCKALYCHSHSILEVLHSQSSSLTDEKLRGAASEFEMILHKISENMRMWASWGLLRAFLKRGDISKGLTQAFDDFVMYQAKFDVRNSHLQGIRDVQEVQRQDSLEIRSALEHILTEQKHMQTLFQMQQQGEPVAQEVMRVAQTELRSFSIDTPAYDQYSRFVLQIYESTGTMPAVQNISHEVRQIGSIVTAGMHSEIYKGLWVNNVEVALKTLRSVIVTPPLIRGNALISDFGLSRAVEELADIPSYSTTTAVADDGCRWCAPELMTDSPAILASDVYAFAMSILECLISDKPFNHLRRDLQKSPKTQSNPDGQWERAEFDNILETKKSNLIVIDFHAAWCGPCLFVAPAYAKLSEKYKHATFLKVNIELDAAKSVVDKYKVTTIPMFVLIKNKVVVDQLNGADARQLETLIQKHAGTAPSGESSETATGDISLLEFIDLSQSNCLNESPGHSIHSILSSKARNSSPNYLLSEADEHSSGPEKIKLLTNKPSLGFEDVENAEEPAVSQVLHLSEDSVKEAKHVQLRFVRFQAVNSLHIFVASNHGGEDNTRIDAIDIFGTPLEATKSLSGLKKQED
ncbi:hypothetical protein Clacol_006274 [Clathrus columnatus]|uniref:Thioredoxin domain-containing protein n=1 Tax=Clathrus columnatus TaxID=1419009 RepID=A0AAV5AFS2_9AGAM|nr:hypothetical protein Clacol_006274 [Clathrus columnatus]